MRHLFVILMVVLLPLRSWAGDWMAISMSTEVLQGAAAIAVTATYSPSVDTQDCAGHSGSQSDAAEATTVDTDHCSTCVSCLICHSAAMMDITLISVDAPELHRLTAASASPFASASLADTVKPPIS